MMRLQARESIKELVVVLNKVINFQNVKIYRGVKNYLKVPTSFSSHDDLYEYSF